MDEDIFVILRFLKHHDMWEYCSLQQLIVKVKSHSLSDHNSLLDSSQSYSLSHGRNEDDISTLGYDENYCNEEDNERQIGLSYGMLDDAGSVYEPVKLKTISLCCY